MTIHDERPEDEITDDRTKFFEALNRAFAKPAGPGLSGSALLAARVDEAAAAAVVGTVIPDCWLGEYVEQDGVLWCVYGVEPVAGRRNYGRPTDLRRGNGSTSAPSGFYFKPVDWQDANERFFRDRLNRLIEVGSVNR